VTVFELLFASPPACPSYQYHTCGLPPARPLHLQVRDAQDKLVPDDPDYLERHNDIRDELRSTVDHDMNALKN